MQVFWSSSLHGPRQRRSFSRLPNSLLIHIAHILSFPTGDLSYLKIHIRINADQDRCPDRPPLAMLFNKFLRLGIFPGDWKLVNIVPIFKKGKRDFERIIALFPFSLSSSKFQSPAFWRVYGIIYPTSSVANSMAF